MMKKQRNYYDREFKQKAVEERLPKNWESTRSYYIGGEENMKSTRLILPKIMTTG